jgi:hypothetical protein
LAFASSATASADRAAADHWITNGVQFPARFSRLAVAPEVFANLHAEVIAGRLRGLWQPPQTDSNAVVTLWTSMEEPGHWRARDWRSHLMELRGTTWETAVPVEALDVPVVYFATSATRTSTSLSPMRICHPQAVGLDVPDRLFWPYLEGFEQGLFGWHLVTPTTNSHLLRVSGQARTGHASLAALIPEGKRSLTVGTTRVRGWQIERYNATGLRLWLRTRAGVGQARFTLHSNAFTARQVVAVLPRFFPLHDQWQRVDLPFGSFPKLPLREVDWFTIELTGAGRCEFILDDLQYMGLWGLGRE